MLKVSHSLNDGLTKKNDPLCLTTLAMEQAMVQLGNHLQIYKDGSALETGEVGCAFVSPDLKITEHHKLSTGFSKSSAELYTIHAACNTVNDLPNPPLRVAILPDSKSALQAFAASGTKN